MTMGLYWIITSLLRESRIGSFHLRLRGRSDDGLHRELLLLQWNNDLVLLGNRNAILVVHRRAEMIARCLIFAAFAIVVSFPGPLTAQDSGSGNSDDELLYRSIRKLEVDKPLRIEMMNGARFTGTLTRHLADTLYLTDSLGEHGVPFGSIKSIWKRGRSTTTGLLIGLGIGFVAGLTVGLIVTASESNTDGVGEFGADIELGGLFAILIGTASGGIIGGVIGWSTPKWHRCYEYRPAVNDGRYGP